MSARARTCALALALLACSPVLGQELSSKQKAKRFDTGGIDPNRVVAFFSYPGEGAVPAWAD